uniref:Uncharacterized protein n=1 Tax=Picea glauca TaxID=3330 RepID=A0A101M1T2_PICGL|nr:hypothetical protein ABT39_MTgene4040 [Picea glauca]
MVLRTAYSLHTSCHEMMTNRSGWKGATDNQQAQRRIEDQALPGAERTVVIRRRTSSSSCY